jgi:hypothetical protein
MKWRYEGQGLEWFFRIVFVLAAIGALSVVGVIAFLVGRFA